ncbi:hypothetical protein F5I97DRAFT_1937885 [Phlebopus sp. FC_14]|nr:hypothetical protein F5I97DRAFT_1937885 [Phlebopus sp. FC_14]
MTFNPNPVGELAKELPEKPIHRRPVGNVISPLKYTNDIVNFDHWDHMFITNCCKRLTLHDFDGPPATVLDLGCGRGLWAIEAARVWQGSVVVGFDVEKVQPKFHLLDRGIARRLKWVHGNLLDGLPFHDGQFDFVRMVRMGLHIPEDEWGYVLEQISRVLKPDGILEIIEEDLIFPCQTPQPLDASPSSRRSSDGGSTWSSDTDLTTTSSPFRKSDPCVKSVELRNSSASALLGASSASLPFSVLQAELSLLRDPKPPDPRDHSRLRCAWEAMLADSFLTPNLLSVLPFHLSSWFGEIRPHPPLHIPLPRNSFHKPGAALPASALPGLIEPETPFGLHTWSAKSPPGFDDVNASATIKKSSQRVISSWATMHLARTTRTITGCKESIWHAYEKLYGQDPLLPSMVRSAKEKYLQKHFNQARSPTNPLRDYFERDWINWENDMVDRASVRECIRSELSWNEPSGMAPEWRVWRNSLPPYCVESERAKGTELCRSLRGFVCFKRKQTNRTIEFGFNDTM